MKKKIKNKTFALVSLFSGGGFLDMGFMNQGFFILEALENNSHFIKAYNIGLENYVKNSPNSFFKNELVKHCKIEKPRDISKKGEQIRLGKKFKYITGIIGGPPCQDFSIGGKNLGIKGDRGRLIKSYLKVVKRTKPDFIFFENVPGIYNTKTHRIVFDKFLNSIIKSGYVVWHDVLNPLYYGFPQDRERLVIVGFKKKIVKTLVKSGFRLKRDNERLTNTNGKHYVFKWPKTLFHNAKAIEW
ncbi:MAG: DNA cytosine methyltransferase, partial [Deltaproteobacteria bacterium]|nr:DNA cytosine methyltransferase [Deltaproteobacteria bacterium]